MRAVRISWVALMAPLVLLSTIAGTREARAQQAPDASQMAGLPLPAPELETGTVSVRVVRQRMTNNVTEHPVTLHTPAGPLRSTTDAQGRAVFPGLTPGTRVRAETAVDGETLVSREFPVPASGGVRVALVAGVGASGRADAGEGRTAEARPGRVVFGGNSRVILEFQQDELQVFYLLDIVNDSGAPVDMGGPIEIQLPERASGAGTLQGSSPQASVQGDRVRITGPFAPGITAVSFGYRYDYRGDTATIVQTWPVPFERLFVAVEKVGALQISSPQFTQQQQVNADGTPFLMAVGGRLDAGQALTLTLTGLPHHSTLMRDVGVAIGFLVLAAGFWGALGARGRTARGATALQRRRDALFGELVALEADRRQGRLDEGRYRARRQALMGQLERVMGELDHGDEGVAA